MNKKCSRCKEPKDISNFWKNKSRKDGYAHECKSCIKKLKHYGREFSCEKCNSTFSIAHRNVSRRKTFKCQKCLANQAIENLKKHNRNNYTGKILNEKGYELTREIINGKYILSHRKVVEEFLKRKLTKEEVIHHVDGNKTNNIIENLLITNNSEHGKIHASLERVAFELLNRDIIVFDKIQKIYKMAD